MDDPREERNLDIANTVGKVFGIIMVVLYFILGATFIFYIPEERIPSKYAIPFGIVVFVYGFYRGYKHYKKYWSR